MTYKRVIPRDLFNEANLLKCLGRLWILLEQSGRDPDAIMQSNGQPFDIRQDEATGSIFARNIVVSINGRSCDLMRPLNSRDAWPLWLENYDGDWDFDPIEVFTDDGEFSADMLALLNAGKD